tara:strand:- start:112 stop:333 length:222 start_codon:yes stop_codon:yes gene_type:complete
MSLKTKQLKNLSVKELTTIADSYALKLVSLEQQGKRDNPRFKQLALELYHISELIDIKVIKYHKGLINKNKNS